MRLLAFFSSSAAVLLLALCFLPSISGRPRALTKQERIASILAQKPMHTTALLAGAAAMPTPSPYPPEDSDLGYTRRRPWSNFYGNPKDDDDESDDDNDDDDEEVRVELKR
ncbi:MAG: hypothetical protein LQ350_002881 [Teloschistes chrysophthalmus]|nr:MAG: hypothetical protein LQ350_002881 [Niorma chrysophthalma]